MPVQLNAIQLDEVMGKPEVQYVDLDQAKISLNIVLFFSYNYNTIYNFGQAVIDVKNLLNPKLKVTIDGITVTNLDVIPKDLPYYDIDYRNNYFESSDDILKSFIARLIPYVQTKFTYVITYKTDYTIHMSMFFENEYDKEVIVQQLNNIQAMLLSNHML